MRRSLEVPEGLAGRSPQKLAQEGVKKIAIHYLTRWQPWVGMGSARAAVENMCRYFAAALARQGVTVNAVSPGASDETTVIGHTPQEVKDALKEWVSAGWTPMRRRVTPADVGNVCALLCSEESFLTGQTIVVDGGSSLMNPDSRWLCKSPNRDCPASSQLGVGQDGILRADC